MSPRRFSLKNALIDIGAALGGALGVSALIRRLSGGSSAVPSESVSTPPAIEVRPARGTRSGATSASAVDEAAINRIATADVASETAMSAPAQHPPAARRVEIRPGWHAPEHMEMPAPTYWPAMMAFGIVLFTWGLITSYVILIVGLLVFAVSLAGWIGELRHGH